ncbi:hypothetical protein R9C00_04180 [Flammeovirgaceae bacterium SG7u.111]|nr:hypothetical protein R9C00_04180 [Flammeovirgaceae bacterium SG7u.111]
MKATATKELEKRGKLYVSHKQKIQKKDSKEAKGQVSPMCNFLKKNGFDILYVY